MKDRLADFLFPVGGGSIGATTSVISNITWSGLWEIALQAAIAGVVGGVIGWAIKRIMDAIFKEK